MFIRLLVVSFIDIALFIGTSTVLLFFTVFLIGNNSFYRNKSQNHGFCKITKGKFVNVVHLDRYSIYYVIYISIV